MSESTNDVLCRWAKSRLSLTETPTTVDIIHEEGWAGTDVTPGDPDRVNAEVYMASGDRITIYDLQVTTALINEILEASRVRL